MTDVAGTYSDVTGTSTSAAIVAGVAAFMKAADPTLTNGVIVYRLASTADPAGTLDQTGNGRVNMARALASTDTQSIQPAGAAPVGDGGPFVGPYTADVVSTANITILSADCVSAAPPSSAVGDSVCAKIAVTTSGMSANEFRIRWFNPSGMQVKERLFSSLPSGTQTHTDTLIANAIGTWTVRTCKTLACMGGNLLDTETFSVADVTPPVITPTVTGTLGSDGWYISNVAVSWSVADPESGIASSTGCSATNLTSDTAGTTLTCSATNGSGLSNSASVTIKLDKTPPSASLAVTAGTLGANGWYTSDVTVSTTGNDSIATPVVCTPNQFQTTETTGATFNGSCTNAAGLKTDAIPLTVKLDKTAPVVGLVVAAGTAGANGWYTSDVTISTQGTETISTPITCTTDQFQTAETTGATFNGSCTNAAGLTGNAAPLMVKLDKTPPTANVVVTGGTLGTNGWYTSDVTVSTTGNDSVSAPVVCTANQVQTAETAGTVFNGSCTNNAGLTTNAAPLAIKLDRTPPAVQVTGPADGATYILGAVPPAGCNTTDALSGVATFASVNVTGGVGGGVGSYTATCSGGKDNAGNTAVAVSITYSVIYDWTGFFQPVDNLPTWNGAKAGSSVPIKFSLNGYQGLAIDGMVETVTAGGSTLNYDPTTDQYIYVWKTDKTWANTCRQLVVKLKDGTYHRANFKLK